MFGLIVRGRIDCTAMLRIRKILKKNNAAIIHGHDFKSNFHLLLASMGMGIKRVVTSHGATKESFKKRLYLFLDDRIFYRFFDNVIAVSEKIGLHLAELGFLNKKVKVIQNGIDTSIIQSERAPDSAEDICFPENSESIFGVIGRLTPDKGHRIFLKAFSRVVKRYPSIKAVFVGDGPIREELKEEIVRLNLEKEILMCGEREDMDYIYSILDCIIIPSLREGLPYSLLEAMTTKKPVIATAVGDIPCLIQHGITGYLSPASDEVALEKNMNTFLGDVPKAKIMAQNAYKLVMEKYSANIMVKEYEKIYESLLKQ